MSDVIDQLTEVESPEHAIMRKAEEGGARSMTSSRAAEGFAQLMDFGDSCSVTSDSGLGHLPPVAQVTHLPPVTQDTRAADDPSSSPHTLPIKHTPVDETVAVTHTPSATTAPPPREHAPLETPNAQPRLVDGGHVHAPSQEEDEEEEKEEEAQERAEEARCAVEEKEECERIVVRGKRQTRSARRLLMGEGDEEKEREEEEEEGEVLRRSSRSRRCLDLGVTGRQKKSLEKVSDWLLKIPLQNAPISQEEGREESQSAGNESSTDDTSSINGHMTHQPANQEQGTAVQVGGVKRLEERVFGRVYGKAPAGLRRKSDSPDEEDTGAVWDTELDVWRTREPGAPWDSEVPVEERPAAAAAEDGQEETPGGDVEQPSGLECDIRQQRKRKRKSQPLTPADFIKRPCNGGEEEEEEAGKTLVEVDGEQSGPAAGEGRESPHQSPPDTPPGSDPALSELELAQVDRGSEAGSEVEVVVGRSAAEGGSEFEVAPAKTRAARGKRKAGMTQDAWTHLQTELNSGVGEKVGRPRRSERPGLENRESRTRPLTLLSAGAEERPLEPHHACGATAVAMARMTVDVAIESFPSSCSNSPDAHDARTFRRGRKLQDFTREVQGEPSLAPPTTSPRPLQLVLSGLQPSQQVLVKKFAKRMGGSVASQVSSRTTHIIINTDEQLVCERTLKYFQGITHRKWVLSYLWVSECIKQDKIVNEEEFEVCGDVVSGQSHRGPQRARLTHQLLFNGVEVCLYGSFTGMTTGQMAEMVELCGGSVVDNPQHFSDMCSSRLIIVQPEVESASALNLSSGALLVSRAWLLDSIGCFSLQDPINYCLQTTLPAT
ncbi:uncharacterized protein LOC134463489 [Engraulis encrasicolus]|uniref:uncharacterized protein LOC134463489 n=1 Tax=Engraulis encrasicolus TaxID=184585 RepID=UPI002FD4D084